VNDRCSAGEVVSVGVVYGIAPKADTVGHEQISDQRHDGAQYERDEEINVDRVAWTMQLPAYQRQQRHTNRSELVAIKIPL